MEDGGHTPGRAHIGSLLLFSIGRYIGLQFLTAHFQVWSAIVHLKAVAFILNSSCIDRFAFQFSTRL